MEAFKLNTQEVEIMSKNTTNIVSEFDTNARVSWFSTKMRCQTCRNSEGSHFFVYDPCPTMLTYAYVNDDRGLS